MAFIYIKDVYGGLNRVALVDINENSLSSDGEVTSIALSDFIVITHMPISQLYIEKEKAQLEHDIFRNSSF